MPHHRLQQPGRLQTLGSFFKVRQTPVWRYAAMLCLALVTTARADAGRHSTTNGVHRGVITREADAATALDPLTLPGGRNFIGQFTLGYAVWTLIQEPVQDFTFIWEWQRGDRSFTNRAGPALSTRDLAKYPDLLKQFYAIKPYRVTLQADLEFYDASGQRIGLGHKTIVPDLVNPAGTNAPLHVPGSPTWAKFFQLDGLAQTNGSDQKALFKAATHVRLVRPEITQIEWSQTAFDLLAERYFRLEQAATNLATTTGAKSNAIAQPRRAGGANPFEQAVRKTTAAPNPFEAASTKARPVANPLELAAQGVRTTPENPLEKTTRLEAEERARQIEAARREEARLAEVARQESVRLAALRREEARQAEVARLERESEQARRDAERQAELAEETYPLPPDEPGTENPYDENDEWHRAVRAQNAEIAADRARRNNDHSFFDNMNRSVQNIINAGTPAASRSSGREVDISTVVAYPNRDRDLSLEVKKGKTYRKVYDVQCPTCSGSGRCHVCRGTGKDGTRREYTGSLPSTQGIKGGVIEAGSDKRPYRDVPADCESCSGNGKCHEFNCNGTGQLAGKYRLVEEP